MFDWLCTASLRRTGWLSVLFAALGIGLFGTLIAAGADGAADPRIKLNSTMFAAQVGSLTTGGSVYAGALPDRKLGQGAIVFTTKGTTTLRVTFQEFFALGSIKGAGNVELVPGSGGRATFTGSLKVNGGTSKYRNAQGKLTASGTIDRAGRVQATVEGSFTH